MKTSDFKSQFIFNRSQRIGILFLTIIIIGSIYISYLDLFHSNTENFIDSNSELVHLKKHLDSLRHAEIAHRKPKIYPFNPNFITDHKAYILGMSTVEFDRLKAYRAQDKWVNSAKDFKTVTGISDSLLETISPYFKFPSWVNQTRVKSKSEFKAYAQVPIKNKKDLNLVTAEMLEVVPGIGESFSQRIVAYRDKMQGFASIEELHAIWGLKPEVIEKVGYQFAVKTPRKIVPYDINRASASDLATIPGVSFDLAKDIWEFVRLREGIDALDELSKIPTLSQGKLVLIKLYLYVEK